MWKSVRCATGSKGAEPRPVQPRYCSVRSKGILVQCFAPLPNSAGPVAQVQRAFAAALIRTSGLRLQPVRFRVHRNKPRFFSIQLHRGELAAPDRAGVDGVDAESREQAEGGPKRYRPGPCSVLNHIAFGASVLAVTISGQPSPLKSANAIP